MKTIDIINSAEFQSALWICVNKSIDACNDCGATYDELYLENKWQKRLLDMPKVAKADSVQIVQYAENKYSF